MSPRIMFKLLLILLLKWAPLSQATKENQEPVFRPSFILPLIMIECEEGTLEYPKNLEDVSIDQENFSKGTRFTTGKPGNQIFFCPRDPESADNKDVAQTTQSFCSYPKNFDDDEILRCTHESIPIIHKPTLRTSGNEVQNISCGPEGKSGVLFFVGYEICANESNYSEPTIDVADYDLNIIELYRFCYDTSNNDVLFTEHTITSPSLLDHEKLQFEQHKTYDMSTNGYQYFGIRFETIKQAYDKLRTPLPKKDQSEEQLETTLMSDQTIHAVKLVSPDDMPFALWRKSTYHYLNVKAMRGKQIKLWEYINESIITDAIMWNKIYTIYTGAFNIPSQYKRKTQPEDPIPVPDIWMKIVLQRDQSMAINTPAKLSFAIIMNNNLDDLSMKTFFDDICKENICENDFKAKFPITNESVRCCYPTKRILEFFSMEGMSSLIMT